METKMLRQLKEDACTLAFNIWDINSAKAVMDAAADAKRGVILQTSSGIFLQMDVPEVRAFVDSYAGSKGICAWLHLDHCKDMEVIREAIANRWDSVMIDASDLRIEENIKKTNQVIAMAHPKGILVEAELGQIGGTEEDIQVSSDSLADRDEIQRFLKETEADMIAVAFGNAHGIYRGKPKLHLELIDYVAQISEIPFVVHGGSGLQADMIRNLSHMEYVKKINISTEVKLAYREGILNSMRIGLLEQEDFQAVRVEQEIHGAICRMAAEKFRIIA